MMNCCGRIPVSNRMKPSVVWLAIVLWKRIVCGIH